MKRTDETRREERACSHTGCMILITPREMFFFYLLELFISFSHFNLRDACCDAAERTESLTARLRSSVDTIKHDDAAFWFKFEIIRKSRRYFSTVSTSFGHNVKINLWNVEDLWQTWRLHRMFDFGLLMSPCCFPRHQTTHSVVEYFITSHGYFTARSSLPSLENKTWEKRFRS